MATTSESDDAPWAEHHPAVDRRTFEHQVGDHCAEAAADDLGDDVEAGIASRDATKAAVDQGDDRVEVGTGDSAEHPDQGDQRASGSGRVLQQLEADIVGREAGRHDPRADDGDDQQAGAKSFGDQPSGEIQL